MIHDEAVTSVPAEDDQCSLIDWEALRRRSLQPGGFGDDRVDLWPKLLNVDTSRLEASTFPVDATPHQDERQIGLDTDRSFVLYPVDRKYDRDALQANLHQLLVSLFRKRSKLSYFQGYHDITSVLFLTLPLELQLPCVEKLSLHRLRDSMGSGLEPVVGLLRVTSNLLRLVDPEYAAILERVSPLPFFALSNLLTLFSHDIPTLPLIQHVFDYLLCRPPIASVYLATAIILCRKAEVIRLEEEGEEGMVHSLLSSLPNLVDSDDSLVKVEDTDSKDLLDKEIDDSVTSDQTLLSEGLLAGRAAQSTPDEGDEVKKECTISNLSSSATLDQSDVRETAIPNPLPEACEGDTISHQTSSVAIGDTSTPPQVSSVKVEDEGSDPLGFNQDHGYGADRSWPRPSKIMLVDLLHRADELQAEFPSSHPALALSSILGPQSVVFTWSESPSLLPSDNTAEAMVLRPELVVYPYVEPAEELSKEDDFGQATQKQKKVSRRLRKSPLGQLEKKTVLAGAVLVLGVAVAVYGIKSRSAHGPAHPLLSVLENYNHGRVGVRDWRRLGRWVGGAVAGLGNKIANGLTSGQAL